ncbi:competence protein ComEC [Spiroplasma helicoides]|uniref:Competence protein ComEC n=1 Tax=Spiroplasma helicoides TaxID=216938 RepID=A0A1B3SLP9_9MOLU|nr:MBL fold metallo-hydrolase [Spiroplasma helicoides]AOG60861.1 competence protein ComEC [Spiroplasma helicoides]
MKKILSILSGISLTLTSCSSLVSCKSNNETYSNNQIDENKISYYTLSIGNGLFSYMQIGSKAIIFDAGIGLDPDASWTGDLHKGNEFATNFLKWTGVESIEAIFLSHNHSDHYGNLDAITKNFNVANIVLPYHGNSIKSRFVSSKSNSSVDNEKIYVNSNTKLTNFSEKYNFLNIDFYNWSYSEQKYMKTLAFKDENNASTILYFKVNNKSFLLPGDAEQGLGDRLVKNGNLQFENVDVYQVAHHGSKNSLGQNFVDKVKPNICYVSGTNGDSADYKEWGGDHIFPTSQATTNTSSCKERYLTGKVLSDTNSDKQDGDINVNAEWAKESDYLYQNASYEFRFLKDGNISKYYFENTVANESFLKNTEVQKPNYEEYLQNHKLV